MLEALMLLSQQLVMVSVHVSCIKVPQLTVLMRGHWELKVISSMFAAPPYAYSDEYSHPLFTKRFTISYVKASCQNKKEQNISSSLFYRQYLMRTLNTYRNQCICCVQAHATIL